MQSHVFLYEGSRGRLTVRREGNVSKRQSRRDVVTSEECWQPPEAEEVKKPQSLGGGVLPGRHQGFSPVKRISDLQPKEL